MRQTIFLTPRKNMKHCKGCSHPTICNTHGCGAEEARANAARKANTDAAEAEQSSLRRDALRYRLLRRGQHWSVVNGIGDPLRTEGLDAAIDAQIRSCPPNDLAKPPGAALCDRSA